MRKLFMFSFLAVVLHGLHLQQQVINTGHHRKIFSAASAPAVNAPKITPVIFGAGLPVIFTSPTVIQ